MPPSKRSATDTLAPPPAAPSSPLPITFEVLQPSKPASMSAAPPLTWGLASTPFGAALLVWTPGGLCHLDFVSQEMAAPNPSDPSSDSLHSLLAAWPQSRWNRDDAGALHWARSIFASSPTPTPIHLVLRGTAFQLQVWEALMQTRPGEVMSYQDLARRIGHPQAARAVGGALAANVIGYLIPCHRIIRQDGRIGHYRWGVARKAALLDWEAKQAFRGIN
jgi:AraC family transcriptional regulator, regulatory protein of adaptative response / methylated-DNA-[protein]-cysteine methyltransferase